MRILAIAALVAIGCGGSEKATKGELCDAVVDAVCRRVGECGSTASYDQCFSALKKPCCIDNGSCSVKPTDIDDTSAFLAACVPAIEAATCSDIAAGATPHACLMNH